MDKKTELALELGQTIYTNTIRDLQARLDAKDGELKALRGFAKVMFNDYKASKGGNDYPAYALYVHDLIDEDGNPTPLLTGETNDQV